MRPLFTIHAGEYLAGERIQKQFPDCEIWVPVKDTGTDLLITNQNDRKRYAGAQVKFAKDFVPAADGWERQGFSAMCWFSLRQPDVIKASNADVWIFVLHSFTQKNFYCVIIEPAELAQRLEQIKNQTIVDLRVTADKKHCCDVRGLKKPEIQKIAAGDYSGIAGTPRDFSLYLENWKPFTRRLGL
jgi:hypothetical protein